MDPISPKFFLNDGSKISENNEKVTKIENQWEMLYKMIQNCKMTDFGEELDQC